LLEDFLIKQASLYKILNTDQIVLRFFHNQK